jgi:hypothetical protein
MIPITIILVRTACWAVRKVASGDKAVMSFSISELGKK